MRIIKILGILLSLIFFVACKDTKISVTVKNKKGSSANSPGFEINGEQSVVLTGAGINLKGRVEMNPAITSAATPTLTGSGITLRAGTIR